MPLSELVDLEKEKARLTKDLGKKQGELKGLDAKLNNPGFLNKAPAEVVEAEKDRAEKLRSVIAKLNEQLAGME
jgi:valyl-tRNA synthetase